MCVYISEYSCYMNNKNIINFERVKGGIGV